VDQGKYRITVRRLEGSRVQAKIKAIMQNIDNRTQGEIKKIKPSNPGILHSLNL